MAQSGSFHYYEDRNLQLIRLPYREEAISLWILLPEVKADFRRFLAALTREQWEDWRQRTHPVQGTIRLPRFRCEYEANLGEMLQRMGLSVAFDKERADFSRLPDRYYMDGVRQKTLVEVDEEGTKAAAVTEITAGYSGWSVPGERFEMVVNRPFCCTIVDERAEALLFLGAIVDLT